jgi:hypothetical protein
MQRGKKTAAYRYRLSKVTMQAMRAPAFADE